MDNIILIIIPLVILVILYILIFTKKEEFNRVKESWRQYDWFTFFAVIFGGVMLAEAMKSADLIFPSLPLYIAYAVLVVGFILVALVRRARTGRLVMRRMGDERTNLIMAKSSRNAFFTTYLAFFINLFITDTVIPNETGMVLILGVGLLVLLTSAVIYYYQRS